MKVVINRTVKCGECGSTDIWEPVNNLYVKLKCMECGHAKTQDDEVNVEDYGSNSWSSDMNEPIVEKF